ncbi:beta-galactosidase [Paraglaciecola chathamensis]|uniref:beta-galactosidase n=1 Tax=Paraglaciecola chathamensis TaxID=368405 RepID=UPI000587DF3D|nr:beta-galactosidase [Paraglaciecola agarilytica]
MNNIRRYRLAATIAVTVATYLAGCSVSEVSKEQIEKIQYKEHEVLEMLYSFDGDTIPDDINFVDATGTLVSDGSDNSNALRIKMNSSESKYTSVLIQPEKPWDWSNYNDFSIAMDISNQGNVSTQVYFDVSDMDGGNYTRSVAIPVSELSDGKTYYGKMRGHDLGTPEGDINVELNFESGLRGNPPTWQGYNDTQFISMWGSKNLNTKAITQFSLSVQSALRAKEITIDNIRLIKNPPKQQDFLVGLIDKFGQNSTVEFPDKVHDYAELIDQRDAELKSLQNGKKLNSRSKYSGWIDGPKLKASGYFRTEKVNGKWSLVTPDGYLFWSSGIANIRLANTTTLTGYDFDQNYIVQREPGDLTPEDSIGMNRASDQAVKTRFVQSKLRADMFLDLPEYDEPMGAHYGYRREAHSGPLERGEVYSFYRANLDRKYSEMGDFEEMWHKVTVDRMLNWGFTSFGNWIAPALYDNNRIPYFANGWIIGNFKTVSSGNDFWRPLPDVFDPEFKERAEITVKQVAAEVKGNPWCVGVFIDNEMSFGRPDRIETRLGIMLHTLRRDGSEVPTKAKFTNMMKDKYGTIDALNNAWDKSIASWEEFDKGINSDLNNDIQIADYSDMLHAYANQYFAVVSNAVDKFMPNHMYLGSRFPDWGMPIEVVRAAAKHADVVSYNSYKEGLTKKTWEFLAEIDMPSIIGEYHIGSTDSGLYHPGLIHGADQEDRGRMFKDYIYSAIDNPYFVGAHWFQYLDSPITGRAHDGENYNVGFVRTTDVPYKPLVKAAQEVHKELYERRFGKYKE